MTVGVSKKRVRVITQGVASSVEEETDVYVVDTTDANLQLATSSELSSSTDLTGNVTIGSDSNAQVLVGSGPNADVFIGNNGTSSTANIDSDSIYLGSTDGSHNMYIGRHNASTTDSIFIGTGPLSSVTIGSGIDGYGGVNSSVLHVSSRTINIGQTTGNISAHTALTLRGRDINTMATEDYDLKAQGNVVLVANDDSLNGSGVRTYLSLGDGTASLAHTNSSNTIQANCSLSAGTAEISGVTSATLKSDTTAVVSSEQDVSIIASRNVSILGSTSLTCNSPDTNIIANTSLDLYSPAPTIKYDSPKLVSGGMSLNKTIHEISSSIDSTTSGLNTINSGHIKLLARRVQHNTNANLINQTSNVSSIELDNESTNKVSIRSADGILLKAKDQEFETGSSSDRSGPFISLGGLGGELNTVVIGHDKENGNSVGSTYITMLPSSMECAAKNSFAINSGTDTSITTTKGNISLSANSDDATYGDINLTAANDANITTTNGNITISSNTTNASKGEITILADNELKISSNKATPDGNNTIELYAYSSNNITAGNSTVYDADPDQETPYRGTGLVANHNQVYLWRRQRNTGLRVDAGINADTTAGNRFYSSHGFYAGNGNGGTGSGATDGYAPFTGVHMFDVQPDSNISIGDAVIVVNHTAMLTTTPNDKRVVGIVCEILENNRISVASVGDNECGQLKGFKVCNENGTISAGDLLTTSSIAGYLMKQSDDIMRSSTVGKSAVDVVFDNNNLAVDVYGFIYCG